MTPKAVRRQYARTQAYHMDVRAQRYEKINAWKMAEGCIDCGYREDPRALDLDHRDPSLKILSISAMIDHAWPAIVAELRKCDVRCANCHRIKTYFNPVDSRIRRRPASGDVPDGGPTPR